MKHILLISVIFIFMACNNKATDAPPDGSVHAGATDTIATRQIPFVLTGCYQMTLKKDTAFLNLQVVDTTVTGILNYRFFEKDQNKGTLQGVLRND